MQEIAATSFHVTPLWVGGETVSGSVEVDARADGCELLERLQPEPGLKTGAAARWGWVAVPTWIRDS